MTGLKRIEGLTVDEAKKFLRRALSHQEPEIGISPGHDIDAVVILRGAFRNEPNEDLRAKFDAAMYRLILEVGQELLWLPMQVDPEFLARFLTLLTELHYTSARSVVAGWAQLPALKLVESSEGNLHLFALGTALRLRASVPDEVLEEDLRDNRFAATAVGAYMRRSAQDGARAFHEWVLMNASTEVPDIIKVRMVEALRAMQQEHDPKELKEAFTLVLPQDQTGRLRELLRAEGVQV